MICRLKGDDEKADYWAKSFKERRPDASVAMFFDAIPFKDLETRRVMTTALISVGLESD